MGKLIIGDGLLGSEFLEKTGWDLVSRKRNGFDINDIEASIHKKYDVIINCIACTDTYSTDREKHWDVNYVFVNNLINYCNVRNIKLIHISTDYLYTGSVNDASEEDVPVHCNNWYGYTKLLGDGLVQLLSNNYLICRCTHKETPFPYENAWVDQIGNFDYVDKICDLIVNLIDNEKSGVYNVGTELKSMYELAIKTKRVDKIQTPSNVPKSQSMNITKMKNEIRS